jgi:hypothetical protein
VHPTLPSSTSVGSAPDIAVIHLARGPPPGWSRGGKGATAGPRSAGEVAVPRVKVAGGGGRDRGWRRGAAGEDGRDRGWRRTEAGAAAGGGGRDRGWRRAAGGDDGGRRSGWEKERKGGFSPGMRLCGTDS